MAKTRLTNADREAIRGKIMNHKFAPTEVALLAEEHALALQARTRAYGDYLAAMDAAPEGAFHTDDDAHLNIGGKSITLCFGGPVRLFAKHARWNEKMLTLTESDPLAKKIMAWATRREQTKKAAGDLSSSVGATLAAFNTFDDLQKRWPEADRFVTERWRARPDYTANVPMVALRDLSAALDLPPETEAVAA